MKSAFKRWLICLLLVLIILGLGYVHARTANPAFDRIGTPESRILTPTEKTTNAGVFRLSCLDASEAPLGGCWIVFPFGPN